MMDKCDEYLQSWFGWIYNIQHGLSKSKQNQQNFISKFHEKEGQLIKGVTRTFAQRVGGETISQRYDSQSKKFTLSYYHCQSCGDTIIFVSS